MSVANPQRSKFRAAGDLSPPGILIFARAPVPGRCKTRLARRYGAVRAAHLYRAMVEHVVAFACRWAPGHVTLCCAPAVNAPFFMHLARCYGVRRIRQHRGDLGQRMHAAVASGLREYHSVLLMGTDQPTLTPSFFRTVAAVLTHPDTAFLAPTLDGGYWAISMSRAEARVFRGPRWSTSRVAIQTRRRLQRAGLKVHRPMPRNDIDEGRDWQQMERPLRTLLSRSASMPGWRPPCGPAAVTDAHLSQVHATWGPA